MQQKLLSHWFSPYILLSLLCFVLYFPGISSIPMDDRDSAHFAQATRQMLETGNYLQIRYQDIARYQKPPGINWLQALSVKVFSTPESNAVWPYRLPSVIGGWLSVLLTFFFTQKICQRKIAFIASSVLASALLLNVESHLATIDASLLASVVLMQGALWVIYEKSRLNETVNWKWPLIFFLSMAYGIVLKGVTPLVGFLTVFSLSLLDRTTLYLKNIRLFWGILLLLLFTAAWLTGVSYAEHTNYLMQMLHKDLLPKLAGGHESHGAPFGTHLILLVITFWPVSLFLWPTLVRTWQNRVKPIEKFLLAWLIPTWIFFELMPTKLPQYILPVFPALAILSAYAIIEKTAGNTRVMRVLSLVWGLISLLFAFAFLAIPFSLNYSFNLIPAAYYVSIIFAVTSIIAVFYIFKKNYLIALIILIIGNCLGSSIAYQYFLPELKPVWTSELIVQKIEKTIPGKIDNQHPLIVIGYGEPSLVFLLGTHAVKFTSANSQKDIHHAAYVLIDNHESKHLLTSFQRIQTITSFNYTKGRWITLELYKQ